MDEGLLWISGHGHQRRRKVGDTLRRDGIKLRVIGVVVVDRYIQHVQVELADAPVRPRRSPDTGNDATLPAVRVPRALLAALQDEADRRHEPLSGLVRRALREVVTS